ncbi:MAG: YbbR-like domain-containing protein [Prevotellaceae bacterium]|jgi:hypothetical protein|nr:YbbR-like domain-containing protein [Prevotellaceae bacterium]
MEHHALPNQPLQRLQTLIARDRRILTFGFFLLASATLWVVLKLSNTFVADIPAKVVLTVPSASGVMLTSSYVIPVQLRIQARGSSIFRYKLFQSERILVNLGNLHPADADRDSTALPTTNIRNAVVRLLGENFELQAISPDTIYFQLSRSTVKKVPVAANLHLIFAPEYMQLGKTVLQPDSVTISGPHEIVAQVSEVSTVQVKRDGVGADLTGRAQLSAPPQTSLSHSSVTYAIRAQRVTQIAYDLPIYLTDAPDSLRVTLLPTTARVSFSITTASCDKLKPSELYLRASYRDLAPSLTGQLRVSLNKPPSDVLSTTIAPEFVYAIVEKP